MSCVGVCYRKRASFGSELGCHVNPPINIVVNHAVVVVPENVKWQLRALDYVTLEFQS